MIRLIVLSSSVLSGDSFPVTSILPDFSPGSWMIPEIGTQNLRFCHYIMVMVVVVDSKPNLVL
jgi:hypothetical protein